MRQRFRHCVSMPCTLFIAFGMWMMIGSQNAHATQVEQKLSVFVNKNGGTYAKGYSDSASNHSSLLGSGLDVASLRGFTGEAHQWSQFLTCLEEQFEPYQIEWIQEEPAFGSYMELVVGDVPETLGLHEKTVGIAPMDKEGRRILPKAVVFVFAERIGTNHPQRMCEVAAQEIGHALGLDHSYLCEDPMSYLKGCGAKIFQNRAAPCGEHAPRACKNGATTQNTVHLLADRLGLRSGYEHMKTGGVTPQLVANEEEAPSDAKPSGGLPALPGDEAKTMAERDDVHP